MVGRERIVAVSLLTESKLTVVGRTLQRVYHLDGDHAFDDLLSAIDQADRRLRDGSADAASGG